MPITLAQAKVNMNSKIDISVVDTFRRKSMIFEKAVFDDAVSPATGGSTLVYGWTMLKTASKADTRGINEEYTASEAIKEKKTQELSILGGSFKIDRVIAKTSGAIKEVDFQLREKIKSTINEFTNLLFNGNHTTNSKEFDGILKLLEGTDSIIDCQAVNIGGQMDAKIAEGLCEKMDEAFSQMEEMPDLIVTSKMGKRKLIAAARILGYHEQAKDEFGRPIDTYNGVPIIDAGSYSKDGSTTVEIVPSTGNKTSYFFIHFGDDGLVCVTPTGSKIIETTVPDFTTAGAVKEGDVEIVIAPAIKNTNNVCVLKDFSLAGPLAAAAAASEEPSADK